jgi:hypothetical protein
MQIDDCRKIFLELKLRPKYSEIRTYGDLYRIFVYQPASFFGRPPLLSPISGYRISDNSLQFSERFKDRRIREML